MSPNCVPMRVYFDNGAVFDRTSSSPSRDNWTEAPLRDLIRHVVLEYHDCLRLAAMAAGSLTQAARAFEERLEAILSLEEESLFPAIRLCDEAAANGSHLPSEAVSVIRTLIPKIRSEQQEVEQLFEALAGELQTPDGRTPSEPLHWLGAELRAYRHLEDGTLFERVLSLVDKRRMNGR